MSSTLRLRFEEAFKTDEIILDIFGYLSPNDVLYSFLNLNARFNTLINSGYKQHLDLSSLSYEQFIYFTKTNISVISSDVETLVINNESSKCFVKILLGQFSKPLSQVFPNVQKVVMSHLKQDELDIYSKELKHLSQLKHLVVHDYCTSEDKQIQERIFNDLFFSNTHLQSFQCTTDGPVEHCDICDIEEKHFSPSSYSPVTAKRKNVSSELTDITIQLRSFQDLIWLFTIAPNVKTLKVNLCVYYADVDYQNIKQLLQTFIQPKNLEEFHLTGYVAEFHFLELLFQRLSFSGGGKLRRLYLKNRAEWRYVNNDNYSFLNGDRWQPLVTDLDEFHCSLCVHLKDLNDDEKQLTSFRTPFWLSEKKFYFKNFYRREYERGYDYIYEEIFYLETIPYQFSNMKVTSAEKITTTNEQKILLPYRHVTSFDCTQLSLQLHLDFMLECRLNIKQLNLSIYEWRVNHTEIDQLELSFPKLKRLACHIQHYRSAKPVKDAEYFVKFAVKLLTLAPNLHYLKIDMKTISEISRLKQAKPQQLPPFCARLKYLEVYKDDKLISKETDEIQDVFQQSLHKIEYLKLTIQIDRILPCRSLLEIRFAQILNSFTNLHCVTIEYRSRGPESQQYLKGEQLENNVKQWLIDNTRLKDINQFYVDGSDDDCLTIFM